MSRSRLSSRALLLCVETELAVHGVADVSLEGADGYPLGLSLGEHPVEVDPTFGVVLADLADGHHVDGVVELTVAPSTEPVDDPTTGGQLDGSYSGIGGELVPGGEPTDIPGVADQLTGQDGTDAVELGQRGPRGPNGSLDALVGLLQLHVESPHVVKQLQGQVVAGLFHRGHRIEGTEQPHRVRSVEFLGDSAW